MEKELKHPSKYWVEYKSKTYNKSKSEKELREIRKAFYAGIDATFDFFLTFDHSQSTAKQVAEDLRWFHRHSKARLIRL